MRFQSTPRFAVSSAIGGTQGRNIEDVEDVESGQSQSQTTEASGTKQVSDSIEIDSDSPSEDAVIEYTRDDMVDENEAYDDEPVTVSDNETVERVPKRRRLSTSTSPPEGRNIGSETSTAYNKDGYSSDYQAYNTNEDEPIQELTSEPRSAQPIFQPAPRFKPAAEDEGHTAEGFPPAFSPQRRGAKYVAGGLAAELQSWLSEVKGWDGPGDTESGAIVRLAVREVRPGRRMYLVRGCVRSRGMIPGDEGDETKFILAGEGRLTGLGRRAVIEAGSVVRIAAPVWDVVLDGVTWTVACEWSIE
jgi:hypothetical protein